MLLLGIATHFLQSIRIPPPANHVFGHQKGKGQASGRKRPFIKHADFLEQENNSEYAILMCHQFRVCPS